MSYYLYGILPAPGPDQVDIPGLDDQPVLLQPLADVIFVYSPATRERYRTSRLNLITHEKILETLMHQGFTCLLPLQFGLVVQDWQQVTGDLLTPFHQELNQLFIRLKGMREVGVKVYWQPEVELKKVADENDQVQKERDALLGKTLSMDETIYIGQLIERTLERQKNQIIEHFNRMLCPLAQEVKVSEPMTKEMIYNTAFLIPWEIEPRFEAEIYRLDCQYGDRLRIRYNNFTAPYNFAVLSN